jgi:hypothetical protein
LIGVPPSSLISESPAVGKEGAWAPLGQFYSYPFVPGVSNAKKADFWNRDDLAEGRYYRRVLWWFLTNEAADYQKDLIAEHAGRPFQLWLGSSLRGDEHAADLETSKGPVITLWWALHVALVLAAIALLMLRRELRRQTEPWWTLALAFTVALSLAAPLEARYVLPFMPFILGICGLGVSQLKRGSAHAT